MGLDRQLWIKHLNEVRTNPNQFPRPEGTKLSTWAIEVWRMILEIRATIERDLRSALKEEPSFNTILSTYRKYDEDYYEVYLFLRREFPRNANIFPLVRGGLLVPELANLEMNLHKRKVNLKFASESLEVCRRINQEMGWHCPDVDKQIRKIEKYIGLCTMTNLQ